jgi:hypothetical protein
MDQWEHDIHIWGQVELLTKDSLGDVDIRVENCYT